MRLKALPKPVLMRFAAQVGPLPGFDGVGAFPRRFPDG
jgi:hypothetical protein